jgi:F0F1-type ATP synthase gamma subunit
MEAAHQNIGKKSEELSRLARRLRQEIITTEILDLISGVEAISSS